MNHTVTGGFRSTKLSLIIPSLQKLDQDIKLCFDQPLSTSPRQIGRGD
jgi:hypothetical protein